MIAALCRSTARLAGPTQDIAPSFTPLRVSGRKKSALFELAQRFCLAVEKASPQMPAAPDAWNVAELTASAAMESRKTVRTAFSLLSSRSHPDAVWPAFSTGSFACLDDPGDILETEMLAAGTAAALQGTHPYVLMRILSARLGAEYHEKATEWILDRIRRRRSTPEELIVPGELPDLLYEIKEEGGRLGHAIRAAGGEMAAAALAGCPEEDIKAARACFGRIGGAVLADSVRRYRARLSTDEIADAQSAFADIIRALRTEYEDTSPGREGTVEPEILPDPALVEDLSDLILELDPRILKSVVVPMSSKRMAALFQTMSPAARERIFSVTGAMKEGRIINALENMEQMGVFELTREAQGFAQKILAQSAPRGIARGKQIQVPLKVRKLLTAILGRE